MNQITFWKISIRPHHFAAWERYFTDCPTVQDVRKVVQSEESPGWARTLELLGLVKVPLGGAGPEGKDITLEVAGTVVGYISLRQFKMYTQETENA